MQYDVIVVGASFAGASAAMQLVRARRKVLLVDAGLPRNRFSHASHGFLGQDGTPPHEIVAIAVQQLMAYPSFELAVAHAEHAAADEHGVSVTLEDGRSFRAHRLILATGVRDELPAIPGLQERWGQTVIHCPYCHGYEVRDRQLGVIATSPLSAHQGIMLPDWGPTTYFTQGQFEPEEAELDLMRKRGVAIERTPVVAVIGTAPEIDAVQLADGRSVEIGALFVGPRVHMSSPLAMQLGCAFEQGPIGPYIRTDEMRQTSVPKVFAAGDAAMVFSNGTMASASGVMAGVSAHRSLVME
ncbi:NAD(P)/FAD-dependent oxidoreductase [Herbaspirillum sp. LeCh32-8]|uniref:NAD(P)/FAD-dependent oxidoreductase n=1 Tax=Herbaspirillum sp. LeCh32-8 TaxID=2821356 RepID=UPI001AEAE798|nr:NAD(P)/FAD-dependent oxidoreductase [Herbaspirillum sp. LeCh32-8]MBP0599781.1 NAD(P)/FAD-dependent oxidoreductase [Herbaspirillum sp. LeCh32-8]